LHFNAFLQPLTYIRYSDIYVEFLRKYKRVSYIILYNIYYTKLYSSLYPLLCDNRTRVYLKTVFHKNLILHRDNVNIIIFYIVGVNTYKI